MDHQGFTGIADTDSLGFCVQNNVRSHLKIRGLIHIDVTVSCTCLDHRDRTVFHHGPDQTCAAPRNQDVHITVHFHKRLRGLPGSILNQRQRRFGKPLFLQTRLERLNDRLIGMDRVAAAFQNHYISRFEAKAKRVCRDIRPRFVNDSHHAERHTLLSDQQSVGTFFHPCHFSYRILQFLQRLQSLCHAFHPVLCQVQTVQQTFRHSLGTSVFHVQCIGTENFLRIFSQIVCCFM